MTPNQLKQDINLQQRIYELGWSAWELSKAYTAYQGEELSEKNIRCNYTTVKRAIENPNSISLGIYKNIIASLGGKILHEWT